MIMVREIMTMFGKKIAIALTLTIASTLAAHAQTPSIIEEFKDWGAYSYQSASGKVCYVLSPHKTAAPLSEGGKTLSHGQNYLLIAQRKGQNVSYEPQVMMSYKMKEGSKVNLNVGNKAFTFYTRGKVAHLENAAEEPALVSALRGGSSVSIKVFSSRNGNARDYSFSLSGVTAALKKIASCN